MKIKHLNNALLSTACGLSLLCAGLTESQASSLTPGTTLGSLQFATGEPDPVGAGTLFSTGPVPWIGTFSFSGTLTSSVLTNDTSNPNGLSALTFTYLFTVDGSSPHDASTISIASFASFLTDVSYQTPAAGVSPLLVTRSLESPGVGANVRFHFGPEVNAGQSTALLVVQTDATAWDFSIASILNSSAAANILTVAPVNAVPEPASAGLVLLGMGAMVWLRRKQVRA